MKKITVFILVIVLGTACSGSEKPAGLLSEDKVVEVLVDIHMAEGMVSALPIPYDSSRKIYPVLEKEIFEKHQVSDSVFMDSFEYYLRDARTMENIYSRTIDSLAVRAKTGDQ
ncbi:MAG TPA: DUF4296 domain-containing protein [Cyclobacteriaceae bacterium]|nr:DUF4296 domain-containing protein [Cyclobacteriaceae bacterium]